MTITLNPRTLFGIAVGMAIAVIAFIAFQSVTADAVSEGESTFVAITPCRLFDTRAGGVGVRSTPLGADETHPFQVTGTNGDCTIPAAATAVSINLTGVGPTTATNLRAFPAGAAVPNASAVNMVAGQGPTPNKLDVKLSSSGKLAVFNRFGSIDVIGDVMGYYRTDGLTGIESRLATLEAADTAQAAKIATLEAAKTALEADVAALETAGAAQDVKISALETAKTALEAAGTAQDAKISALETKLASVSNVTVDGQPTVRFTGVNVQVVDGSGDTAGTINGRGNLIVGYNENASDTRTGSHNIVLGENHTYTTYGGLVAGSDNVVSGANGVAAGWQNTASAAHATVTGGFGNTASGQDSAVSGGQFNIASAATATVSGGAFNIASAAAATVSGGSQNDADQSSSTVSGGSGRVVSGLGGDGFDWVGGGLFQDF